MQSKLPSHFIEEPRTVGSGSDQEEESGKIFSIIDSLIDEPVRQLLILMSEHGIDLPVDRSRNYSFHASFNDGSWITGGISPRDMADKLEGTDLIEIKARGPSILITDTGNKFVSWLISNNRKADYFDSQFGSWGTPHVPADLLNHIRRQ